MILSSFSSFWDTRKKNFEEACFDAEGNYKFDLASLTPPTEFEKDKDVAHIW